MEAESRLAEIAPVADISTSVHQCRTMPERDLPPFENALRLGGLAVATIGCLFALFFLGAFVYNWPGPIYSTLPAKAYFVAVMLPPVAAFWLFLRKRMWWASGFVIVQIVAIAMASLGMIQ